jgi:hypothetical protein
MSSMTSAQQHSSHRAKRLHPVIVTGALYFLRPEKDVMDLSKFVVYRYI